MLKRLIRFTYLFKPGSGLDFSEMLQDIRSRLECAEREKKTLDGLQSSGKISKLTYDELSKGYAKIIDKMRDLKETLEQEQDFWMSNLDEQRKVMERILIGLEFSYISKELDLTEWKRMRDILTVGLDSMYALKSSSAESYSRPDPSNLVLDEETGAVGSEDATETDLIREDDDMTVPKVAVLQEQMKEKIWADAKKNNVGLRLQKRTKNHPRRNRTKMRIGSTLTAHCRNPWNTKCKNTDIELSIYYKSEFLPICHECWQEISTRNLEWSST